MKIPAFLSKLPELVLWPVFWIGRALSKIWFTIFGRVSWSPPNWFSKGRSAWTGFSDSRPRTTASLLIAILLLSCGSIWTWKWYQSRPKPHRVSATIAAIPVTKLDKELQYPPLVIRFSDPAARLEDLKKPSLTGVRLSRKLPAPGPGVRTGN